jgi:ubiquinone/menaquinone biosynthesis C-methylase UbiE
MSDTIAKAGMWGNLDDFHFMEEPVRFAHPSHDVVTEFLVSSYGANPFSFLDCGVLSAVTIRKLADVPLRAAYTGIDLSAPVVRDCRRRFPETDWRVMDIESLAFPESSFDVVHVRHTLEHLSYYERALRECRRVARRHVIVALFLPLGGEDCLERRVTAKGRMFFNAYGRPAFTAFLSSLFARWREVTVAGPERDNQVFLCER